MIQATVVGNIGKDAELRQAGADNVCSFSVASTRKAKDKETTTWVRCSLWGKRGDALVKHLTKGKKVVALGELSTREHDGKTYLELRVSELEFAGANRSEATNGAAASAASTAPATTPATAPAQSSGGDGYGEIPF